MESSSEEEAKGISGGEEGAQFSYPMINPHHHQNQIHHNTSFQSTAPPPPPSSDMFNEEMIHHSSSIWKPFFPKDGGSGSPKSTPAGDDHQFYQFNPTAGMMTSTVDEDPNNNNKPPPPPPRSSSTLSLSLSSTIGLQQQNQMAAAAMLQTGGNMNPSLYEFELRRSRYMVAAQELLNEFCSLGSSTKQTDAKQPLKSKPLDVDDDDDDDDTSSSSSRRIKPSPGSLEFLELQKRKTKLYSLLEEVDRKYRHYCEQMKAVVSSFESVAGAGAAGVYSVLASKAMSRHFRCLRDGIVAQIQATRKTMGEKDPVAPGTTRGETPRLKVIDQTIRQHKAFQQMNMMESHPWRPQRGLPERSVSVLRAWLFEHFLHPYPSDVDKHILARQTGLSRSQVSNWFINARVRLWKPMVEELYVEETKDHEDNLFNNNNNNLMLTSSDGEVATTFDDHNLQDDDNNNMNIRMLSSSTSNYFSSSDQKPTQDQLIRLDPDCLSSIISNSDHHKAFQNHHQEQQQHMAQNQNHAGFGAFGAVELDHFSAYNHQSSTSTSHLHHHHHHHQQQLGGGVSLTLGLQQHGGGGGGVSLAFTPVASQSSNLFFPRDHNIEQQEQVHHHHQYSLLEGDHDQGQNLPYRNLMGAQLLRDFAG